MLGPSTFEAPGTWRERARVVAMPEAPEVVLVVPHPHDVLVAKIARYTPTDQEHVRLILAEHRIDRARLGALAAESPNRSSADPAVVAGFEANLARVLALLPG